MADAAGFISGVIATWKACLEISDIIDRRGEYGRDHEGLLVKLDVERNRLLTWGNAVGLGDAGHDSSSLHSRLQLDDVRTTVTCLLGRIRHVFERADSPGNPYGLRPAAPRPTQSQRTMGMAFKRAYGVLRKSARGRQQETPLPEKTLWAIRDGKKFQRMVDEINGFSDDLERLFAEDISDCTGARPENHGVATTASSHIADATVGEEEMNEDLLREVEAVKDFVAKKSEGCLVLHLRGPYTHSARVTAHVDWNGSHQDNDFPREDQVSVTSGHASLGEWTTSITVDLHCSQLGTGG